MKEGYHIYLAKLLNQFVNDEYSELVFLEPISLRKVLRDNIVYLPINDLGSGAEKAIKIMALLKVMSPKLVIIDDFESGFHPSLINLFLEWLKNEKWQTVISTHSIDVLNRLTDISPEHATIIKLNKSKEDVLSHESLKLEDLEDIMNANIDPRKLGDVLGL
jgi:predicted ATPase